MENEKKPHVMINKKIGNTEEWLWPASDKEAFQILESEWPALEKAINFYVPNLRVDFQAGGNCGMYPKLISEKAQIVYTAEPDPTNFFCLSSTVVKKISSRCRWLLELRLVQFQ